MTRAEAIEAIRREVGRGGRVTSTAIQIYTDARIPGSVFAQACRDGADDFQQARERNRQ